MANDWGMVVLDEEEQQVTNRGTYRRKYKMSENVQALLIIVLGIIVALGVIFVGSYYVGQAGRELKIKQLEKGYVYCKDLDNNHGWRPKERCKNQ